MYFHSQIGIISKVDINGVIFVTLKIPTSCNTD